MSPDSGEHPIYYDFGRFTPPASVALHPYIPKQRVHIDGILKQLGIDEVKVGTEYEFSLVEDRDLSEPKRRQAQEAIKELHQRVCEHAAKMPDAASRLQAIETFTPEELVMYDLHDIEPRMAGKLEPLFGTGRGDHSYYDAKGVLEVKTKPLLPEENTAIKRTFLDVLQEKAAACGLKLATPPDIHCNVSFWQNGQNLLNPSDPKFKTTGAKILNGVLQAANQAEVLNKNSGFAASALAPSRDNEFRLAGEGERARLELRMGDGYGGGMAWKDPETFIECVVKPGAAYGVEQGNTTGLTFTKRAALSRSGEDFKLILHMLQGATLRKEAPNIYQFVLPEGYVNSKLFDVGNAVEIAQDLGLKYDHTYASVMREMVQLREKKRTDALDPDEVMRLQEYDEYISTECRDAVGKDEIKEVLGSAKIIERNGKWQLSFPTSVTNAAGGEPAVNPARLSSEIECSGAVDTVMHPGHPKRNSPELLLFDAPVFDASRGYLAREMREGIDAFVQNEHESYAEWRKDNPLSFGQQKTTPALPEPREPISADLGEMVSAMKGEGLRPEQPVTHKDIGGPLPEVLGDAPRLSPRAISNPEFATALLPKDRKWANQITSEDRNKNIAK